jgi:Fic family protein
LKSNAVFSSNIEGNTLDINSFINSEIHSDAFKKTNQHEEIHDLKAAYQFAMQSKLDEKALKTCHQIATDQILIKDKRGVYRTTRMALYDQNGVVYMPVEAERVQEEMNRLFDSMHKLLSSNLDITQSFYHAGLIHLKFVQIHPFYDGNGRMARLLKSGFWRLHWVTSFGN